MIEKEQVRRGAGELLLLGPGLPHWGVIDKFPLSYITVYFLPWVLVELGPESDGVWILRRFTVQQPAAQRVMRFPPKYRAEFRHRFEEIYHEFSQLGLGREVRLRTLLMEMLVRLLRWEHGIIHLLAAHAPSDGIAPSRMPMSVRRNGGGRKSS